MVIKMKINNIQHIIKSYSQNYLHEGKTIYGKIIKIENNTGIIKLPNGETIQAKFLTDIKSTENNYIKFIIDKIENQTVFLKPLSLEPSFINQQYEKLNNLNIPYDVGKEIIESLAKFQIPANDFFILLVYENLKFFKALRKMDTEKIIDILKNITKENITHKDESYKLIENIINKLKDTDINHLCFLLENDIELNPENILKLQSFLKDIDINDLIEKHAKKETKNKIIDFNDFISKIKICDLQDSIKNLLNFKDLLEKINNNYLIYYFNQYEKNNVFKNLVVIKKDKNTPKDYKVAKIFLRINTDKLGTVEAFLYKNFSNISITFKVEEKYEKIFKNNFSLLSSMLSNKGLKIQNFEVQPLKQKTSLVEINNFFETIKKLDVKI